MPKVGVRIIHGNIEILSEFSKSQGAYYTRKLTVPENLVDNAKVIVSLITVAHWQVK